MKRIKYLYNCPANIGTEAEPEWFDQLFSKTLPYTEEALLIAEAEAFHGEYTVEDDGAEAPDNATADDVMNALLGVTE